jgi:hypothetical protein
VKKAALVTPKQQDLQQLTYLGFLYLIKNPIELLHKIDRLMDAIYCHLEDYEFQEESTRRQEESIGKNNDVKIQMQ